MKNLIATDKLSPIELAKRVMNFKGLAESKSDFEKIKGQLVPENYLERVDQIIKGLEQQDEFAVLCKLMGTCDSLVRIDQNPIIETEEIAPDFLASFKPGCSVQGLNKKDINVTYNCFVEVKSCKANKFKISAKDLKARIQFAQRFGLPLVFAIRFTLFEGHCYWILIDSKQLSRQGRRVEIDSLIGNLSPVLFDDYCIYTHPALHFIHYYDGSSDKSGIRHKTHGVLFKTYMILRDQQPIEIEEQHSVLINALLDSFDFQPVQQEKDGTITAIISHIGNQMRFLSDMVYKVNNLARAENGDPVYDATRVVCRLDSKNSKPWLITREMVEHAVRVLNSKELGLFKVGIGEPKQQEKILRALGRKG